VGSCPTGQLVGDQGEKEEGQSSTGRKVPSSRAFQMKVTLWPRVKGVASRLRAQGEVIQCLKLGDRATELRQGLCNHCLRIAEPIGQPVALGQVASSPV